MTVRQLLESTDSRELSEWAAYFDLINAPKDERETVAEKIKAFFMSKKRKK